MFFAVRVVAQAAYRGHLGDSPANNRLGDVVLPGKGRVSLA